MKILFLDVDGVLNSERSFLARQVRLKAYPNENNDPYFLKITKCTIDPVACDMVNRICEKTGAKIVVSSTHRKHFQDGPHKLDLLKNYFDILGVNGEYIIDWTLSLNTIRGVEIKEWLTRHEHVGIEQYVILDDSCDMLPEQRSSIDGEGALQLGHFVRCPGDVGITAQNYRDVMTLFGYSDSGIIGYL